MIHDNWLVSLHDIVTLRRLHTSAAYIHFMERWDLDGQAMTSHRVYKMVISSTAKMAGDMSS